MAKHYPDTNPYDDQHEALASAYRDGWAHGHGIACHNVPKLGDKIDRCVDHIGLGDKVDADNIREYHELLCYAAEEHSRSYSPFEYTAKAFNDAGEGDEDNPSADELWTAFDEGIHAAIQADLAEYTDADYGIEPGEDAA